MKTRIAAIIISVTAWLGVLPVSVQANLCTNTVQNTNDSGPGSLRAALESASDGDTITFCPGVTGTITLTTGELVVSNSVTIAGPGPGLLVVDGNAASRVFYITNGVTATISGLTISNGLAGPIPIFTSGGGGIYNNHSTLTVINSVLSGNLASNAFGGGIYNDGRGNVSASLTVVTSTLRGNSAGYDGGGIYNDASFAGTATLTVDRSTLSGNAAGLEGGGILNFGGFHGNANLNILNSTFSGNSAVLPGGAIYNDTDTEGTASVVVANSTLSGNSSGIHNQAGMDGDAAVLLGSTILNGSQTISNESGTIVSYGYNLSSDNGGGFLTATGDQTNTPPLLGPLQDNGGPTFTHAPACTSPAHDAGSDLIPFVTTDQRGFPRTFDDPAFTNAVGGDGTDIGAVELPADTTPPTIMCPGNLTLPSATGQCSTTANWTVSASDNCGSVTVSCSPASGSFFNQGTTPVVCTATDLSGNTNSCSFTVTVTQPTAQCGITVGGDSLGPVLCPGRTAILTAPNGKKRYLWHGPERDGATVQTIVVGTEGLYTCTQENWYDGTNCCSVYITVLQPPQCLITPLGPTVLCPGQTVTLVGPATAYRQYWLGPQNNGLNTRSNTVSVAGTYTLHVFSSNNCESACSVTVTRLACP